MPADIIFTNGTIYTIDRANPRAEAMATFRDRILAVGSADDINALKGPETKVIDLGGRVLMPGLNDNHCHPPMYGANLQLVDATAQSVSSIAEIMERFGAAAADAAPDTWIRGWGYDDTRVAEMRHPTRHDLDAVVGDRPAYLTRTCGHIGVASSAALRLAGITRDTPNPQGGEIDHDADGEPTGVLRETAQGLVREHIPTPTKDDIKRNLIVAGKKYLSMGITSWADASIRTSDELMAYQELREAGELPMRTYTMMLIDDTLDALSALGIKTGFGDEWLRLGHLKIFADGALGSRSALMLEPYNNEPENYGIAVRSKENIRDLIRTAAANGIASCIHAIGDAANRLLLDIFEEARADNLGLGLRQRIEHAQVLTATDIGRFAQLGVIPSMQPIHCTSDMFGIDRWWGDRGSFAYVFETLRRSGAVLAFGSDAPVDNLSPIAGIHAAVTRQNASNEPAGGWYPAERLSAQHALEAYTLGAAYASGEEHLKGSLEVGKLGDLTVLSRDILATPGPEILGIEAEATIVGGRVVHGG